jgi:hypothetical protein
VARAFLSPSRSDHHRALQPVAQLVEAGKDLQKLPDIGSSMAEVPQGDRSLD